MNIILEILTISWSIFRESSIYMLFGFFMTGVLHAFVQPEQVVRYPVKGRVRPLLLSGADQNSRTNPAGYFAYGLDLEILQEQRPLFMPAAGTMNHSAAC